MEGFLYNSLVLQAMNSLLAFEKYQEDPEALKIKAFAIADVLMGEFIKRETLRDEMSKHVD